MKTHIRALLREGIDGMTNEALIGKFVDFVVDYLGIKTNLSLVLTTDKSDIETTAFYDIANNIICVYTIYIYTKERAIGDIMRSIAHEMVHHMQNENGLLKGDPSEGADGSNIENEANSKAGEIIRIFGKQNPEIYTNNKLKG